MHRIVLFSLFLTFTCGCFHGDPAESSTGKAETLPVVFISIPNAPPSPDLPWTISRGGEHRSGVILLPEEVCNPVPDEFEIISEAADRNMLIAIINAPLFNDRLGSDHIKIWSDSSGNPISLPVNLLSDTADSSWFDPVSRQKVLSKLFGTYKPDLVFIRLEYTGIEDLLAVAEYWTDPEMLLRYTVILYSLPAASDRRSWAVFAGSGINGSTPMGLTWGGVISTIRLLAGLGWEDSIPQHIPAFSVLIDPESSWTE